MSYVTEQDMVDRYGLDELIALTDCDNTGSINHDRLAAAIADAGARIDGYLGGRYRLPLSPVPLVLASIASDLTRYLLYDNDVPDAVEGRYRHAIDFLKSVARGGVSLGVDDAGGKAEPNDAAELTSGGNVFDRKDNSFI